MFVIQCWMSCRGGARRRLVNTRFLLPQISQTCPIIALAMTDERRFILPQRNPARPCRNHRSTDNSARVSLCAAWQPGNRAVCAPDHSLPRAMKPGDGTAKRTKGATPVLASRFNADSFPEGNQGTKTRRAESGSSFLNSRRVLCGAIETVREIGNGWVEEICRSEHRRIGGDGNPVQQVR